MCYEPINFMIRKISYYHYSDNKVNYTGTPDSTAGHGEKGNHSKPQTIRATNNSTDLLIAEMYMKNENIKFK